MFLISQDGLKAISARAINFFVIPEDRNKRGNFMLMARNSDVEAGNFYDYLILFEHEDLNVVKRVMRFLANDTALIPDEDDEKNILVIDLPDLYRHGMKKIATAETSHDNRADY